MPINIIQVKEYECIKCGYKWINRKNGQNQPVPKRCAKCKQLDWSEGKGYISRKESRVRYQLRYTVGEYLYHSPEHPSYGGKWKTDAKVDELLKYRLSIKDMKVIIQPMSLLIDNNLKMSKAFYDDRYRYWLLEQLGLSSMNELERKKRFYEDLYIKDIGKIRDYKLQLSGQLVEYFLEKYSAPYQQQQQQQQEQQKPVIKRKK